MSGSDHIITDPDHLNQVVQQLMRHVIDLAEAWIREDADACAPASHGDAVRTTGGVPGDPTAGLAGVDWRYRERDRIGRQIVKVKRDLDALLVEARQIAARREARQAAAR